MITRDGQSKNFETITGQDGLTFGITDFATDGGVQDFMQLLHKRYPNEFKEAFGENTNKLLDSKWIQKNHADGHGTKANDNGLIGLRWLREGLDKILTNRHLYGLQLENFKRGKVEPSLSTFRENNFTLEFTLATMIGIANSKGVGNIGKGGMRNDLITAIKQASGSGIEHEKSIAKALLRNYVLADKKSSVNDKQLLEIGFAGLANLSEKGLSHRGRRAYQLFKHFPFAEGKPFTDLGNFILQPDERLPES
jgi:hypothetical protein